MVVAARRQVLCLRTVSAARVKKEQIFV
jgi:hypothetical protein